MTSGRPGDLIIEGKTKKVYERQGYPDQVYLINKPDITAGDGERHDVIPGKEFLVTAQTVKAFELMDDAGIQTHIIDTHGLNGFRAMRATPLPVEVVARAIATGSYLKRHPDAVPNSVFDETVIELFLKKDAWHDPLMVWSAEKKCYELYSAKQPIGPDSYLGDLKDDDYPVFEIGRQARAMEEMAKAAFTVQFDAWERNGYFMPDGKLEFGICNYDKALRVIDVYDLESHRLRRGGIDGPEISKEYYRILNPVTPEGLAQVLANYGEAATACQRLTLAA